MELIFEGKKISYNKVGTGPFIFLIHGLGLDKNIWNEITFLLQKKYTCICLDIPGSGNSEFIPNATLDVYADVIKGILVKENIQKIHIIGHSFGGYISLLFARLYPQYLNSLTLFHSTGYLDNEEKLANRKQVIQIVRQKGTHTFFKNLILNQFAEINRKAFQVKIDSLLKQTAQISVESLIQYQELMINRNSGVHFLETTSIPLLFIIGEYDNFSPKKDIYEQGLLNSKSNICLLTKSAHIGMIEEPLNSAKSIDNFLESIRFY